MNEQIVTFDEQIVDFADQTVGQRIKKLSGKEQWKILHDANFLNAPFMDHFDADRKQLIDDPETFDISGLSPDDVYLVCLTKRERALVSRLRTAGLNGLGIFRELAVREAAFAPPRFFVKDGVYDIPEKRIAIISLPRSASTVLALEMANLGIGAPTEHVQNRMINVARRAKLTGFDLTKWQHTLEHVTSVNGIFCTKIIWDILEVLRRKLPEEQLAALDGFLNFDTFVYIERTNKYDQAVSDYLARATSVWHKWKSKTLNYEEKLQQAVQDVDMEDLRGTYAKFVESERQLKAFLEAGQKNVISVSFEQLSANPVQMAGEIAQQIGFYVPEDKLQKATVLEPTRSTAHAELSEVLRRDIEGG